MYFNDELKPGLRVYLRQSVWTSLLQGLGGIAFGIYAFASPVGTLGIFVNLIGMLLLLHGAMLTISALLGIRRDGMWPVLCGAGIVQLLLGLFITSNSGGISEIALMLSTVGLGMIGIMTGAVSMISAIRYRDAVSNVWAFISRGGLLFVIGISMLLAPFGFGTAMVRAVGLIAFVLGALQAWGAVRLFVELKKGDVKA